MTHRHAPHAPPADAKGKSRRDGDSDSASALLSTRPRTPAQLSRLERLREATRELAHQGGYTAITMRAVAEHAGVGPTTVYRYFSSKDHLIADVHAQKSLQVIAELKARPPRHRQAADRVAAVFRRMLAATAEDLPLASAGVAAITSTDLAASSPEFWNHIVMSSYMDVALGDEDVGDREALGELLGHVFFSLMCGLAVRRMTLKQAEGAMDRAVALALR